MARHADHVYRELQYGLRKAVAARTLDELLGDKATLDAEIFAYVRGRVEALGIEVLGVGVKDVILPGEMRENTPRVARMRRAGPRPVRHDSCNALRYITQSVMVRT